MRVRKAVIPVAGFGTRFLPATKTVPKTMLPIVDKPVIQYVVEGAVAAGIEQVILVTSSNCKALEDYFDTNFELEATLQKTGKLALLEQMRAITNMVDVVYVRQKQPLGNGHAVLMARDIVGDEPFAMQWGDDVLLNDPPVIRQLMDEAERRDAPVVGVRRVGPDDFEKYGMVQVESIPGEPTNGPVMRAIIMVEKPERSQSPSDLAQLGGYVLTPDIFPLLEASQIGPSGEIYLADAVLQLVAQRPVYAYAFEGRR
ncbi:MAG: UTP--glucose-1-phosphate uridylyltransferase [Chloroflexota bacterium]